MSKFNEEEKFGYHENHGAKQEYANHFVKTQDRL